MLEVYRREFESLVERVKVLEEIIGDRTIEETMEALAALGREECSLGQHKWKRTAYDLQGGKWGEDTCQRPGCGQKRSWSV